MIALRVTVKDIKVKRIDMFGLYSGKYRVKCDNSIFILNKEHKSLELCFETVLSKIRFRKQRKTSIVICHAVDKADGQHLGNNVSTEISKNDKDLCWVSEIKKLDEWIPRIIKTIFHVRFQSNSNSNNYFIKRKLDGSGERTVSSINVLSEMLDVILSSSGAVKSSSFDNTTCRIIVVEDFEKIKDQTNTPELQGCHVFSVMSSLLSADGERNLSNIYFREHIFTGVLNVLLEMSLITCKRPKRKKNVSHKEV
ncbi:uncharacterized protein LOC128556032 [Mercenaria mercenaria]|uniref:uncharacterized protein LOC128556032 n=1 Tax=Mercenaria mercenaria TaxID=6596 RepID=UPI00234F9D25|nr:uncharacterized protein LOC128556032 [Mercenaria mercenaria]